jgi:hypothetical protein
VRVDDWYQAKGHALLKGRPGAKPVFSDSEMITLMLAEDLIPYRGEQQFVSYMRANHRALFPKLVDQSQFNRRARSLHGLVEALRRDWLVELGIERINHFLIDTKPILVVGYKRSKTRSNFAGSADYGYFERLRAKTAISLELVAYTSRCLLTMRRKPLIFMRESGMAMPLRFP